MNKSKQSILTAISAIVLTLLNGVFSLVVTKLVIVAYGSDFNGINSTATQFISMLLVIEGGFTVATNVALFKPMAQQDEQKINSILSATSKIFNKIGIAFFVIGGLGSLIYAPIINTEMSPVISLLTFLMTIFSTAFNLSYATKYRIVLQAENEEYVLNYIQIGTLIIGQLLTLLTIYLNGHMLFVRFSTMIGSIFNTLLIAVVVNKKYKNIDFKVKPDYSSIQGTKDIFIQKITSIIYTTIPVLYIAGTAGTVIASVYVVYNNVFRLLKNVVYSFINGPRLGFGKLIATKSSQYVSKVFLQYEFIVMYVMFVLISTTAVLIMPFINLYTMGITDVNYSNWIIAVLLLLTTFFEIIHIPSGNIINMAGEFKIGKQIQAIASVVLLVTMAVGNAYFSFYGILFAVLITAVLLAILEIYYIHNVYFEKAFMSFCRILIPNLLLSVLVTFLEIHYLPTISTYFNFFVAGVILIVLNSFILGILNYLVNRQILFDVIGRLLPIIKRKK